MSAADTGSSEATISCYVGSYTGGFSSSTSGVTEHTDCAVCSVS